MYLPLKFSASFPSNPICKPTHCHGDFSLLCACYVGNAILTGNFQRTIYGPTKHQNAKTRTQQIQKPTKTSNRKVQLAILVSVGESTMDDFTATETSPIILIALTSTAKILQQIIISPTSPLPHWCKSSPRANNQNACKHLRRWTPCISECLRGPLCRRVKSLTLPWGIQESERGFLLSLLMHQQA